MDRLTLRSVLLPHTSALSRLIGIATAYNPHMSSRQETRTTMPLQYRVEAACVTHDCEFVGARGSSEPEEERAAAFGGCCVRQENVEWRSRRLLLTGVA